MMGEKNLLREGLMHILCEILENYSKKKIYVLLDKDKYEDLKDYIVELIDKNVPAFIKNTLELKEYKEDNKLGILGKGAIYKIEFEFFCNLNLERYSEEVAGLTSYILKLSDINKAEFFKMAEENKCQTIADLYKLSINANFEQEPEQIKENNIDKWIEQLVDLKPDDKLEEYINNINDNISELMLNEYLKEILSKPENISVDYFSPKKELYRLILFEDLLSVDYNNVFTKKLSFDVNYIKKWFKSNIIDEFKNTYGEGYLDELNVELKNYETIDFRGENFNKIKLALTEVIKEKISEDTVEKEVSILEEKDSLQKNVEDIDLQSVGDIFDLADKFKDIEINYKENQGVLKDKYSERIIEILEDGKQEISIKVLNEFVNKNKHYFNEKAYVFMQVYIQKELEKIKEQLIEDLKIVNDIKSLAKIQDEILSNGEFVVCRDIEEIIMEKLEEIVKKLNLADINDEENINTGICICDKTQIVDLNEYEVVAILTDREVNIDLNNIGDTIEELMCIVEFVKEVSIKNCMFNHNYYNLEMNVNNGENFYTVKYKYIKDLIDYIKLKNKRYFLVKLKSISTKVRYKHRIFKRGNAELIEELDEFYKK